MPNARLAMLHPVLAFAVQDQSSSLPDMARYKLQNCQVGVMRCFVGVCESGIVAAAGAILFMPTSVCFGMVAAHSRAAV